MAEENDAHGNQRRIIENKQKAKMPVQRYAKYYNFNHKNRGIALIFNHENYDVMNKDLPQRLGTNADCENIVNSLQNLDFTVRTFKDLKYHGILEEIDAVSTMDHTDNDCLVIVILTHGELNILFSYDIAYKLESIWMPFAADKCPSLAGKPKLLFIQACQGDKFDAGITMLKRVEHDNGSSNMSYRIPKYADFLIAYSTLPGFFSWRNTRNGSWFIQALCKELNESAKKEHLLTLLTFVCQTVAFEYESNVPSNIGLHQMKQIPCISTMLTRLIKFNDK